MKKQIPHTQYGEKRKSSYKDLQVWNKSITLCKEMYTVTSLLPKEELYGLTSQMRRAAISIPSNIAEGQCRSTQKDFKHFLHVAYGSCAELDTQITLAKELFPTLDYSSAEQLVDEVMRMINGLIQKIQASSESARSAQSRNS